MDKLEKGITASVFFTPTHPCKNIICKLIRSAEKSIKIQAFIFTCDVISKELIKKKKASGIPIDIIVYRINKGRGKLKSEKDVSEALGNMWEAGIKFYVDTVFNHNKYIIIDDLIVITGSMNFSTGSETNRENIIIIHNKQIAGNYKEDWLLSKKDTVFIK